MFLSENNVYWILLLYVGIDVPTTWTKLSKLIIWSSNHMSYYVRRSIRLMSWQFCICHYVGTRIPRFKSWILSWLTNKTIVFVDSRLVALAKGITRALPYFPKWRFIPWRISFSKFGSKTSTEERFFACSFKFRGKNYHLTLGPSQPEKSGHTTSLLERNKEKKEKLSLQLFWRR